MADTALEDMRLGVSMLQSHIYNGNVAVGWWDDINTLEELDAAVPTKLCLIHSEISEAMEGHRKQLKDDKLPHRDMLEVELADAVIRILDLAGALNYNLAFAIMEKLEFNASRADHKRENRAASGGKRY
jgi:NTP pyrophosphatase (non-canonical NTP hydrolase)